MCTNLIFLILPDSYFSFCPKLRCGDDDIIIGNYYSDWPDNLIAMFRDEIIDDYTMKIFFKWIWDYFPLLSLMYIHDMIIVFGVHLCVVNSVQCYIGWCQSVFDGMGHGGWHASHRSGCWMVSVRFWGSRFETGLQLMKQFAPWHFSFCQCTDTCLRNIK